MTAPIGSYRCPMCQVTLTVDPDGKLNFVLPRGKFTFPVSPPHGCEFTKATNMIDFSKLEKVS